MSAILTLRQGFLGLLQKIGEMLLDVSAASASKGNNGTKSIISDCWHSKQQSYLFQTSSRWIVSYIELIVATA
jgi:hypothetical protein